MDKLVQLDYLWWEGETDGHWWQAKVYDEGSQYGIGKGRVSKLAVCSGNQWDHEQVIYHYDHGLDIDTAPAGLVDKIITLFDISILTQPLDWV